MSERDEEPRYTYIGAAARVRRSVYTIKQWRREGMATERDDLGRVVVRHSVLMAEFRRRLASDPVHQLRLRRATEVEPAGLDSRASHPPTL
ncbi:hypothetical protein ACWGOE_07335 [Leucobacter chromiiresistens]